MATVLRPFVPFVILLLIVAAGCGGADVAAPADAIDAVSPADAPLDSARADAARDALPPDTPAPDGVADAAPETVGPDGAADAGPDAAPDAEPDVAPDVAPDAGPDVPLLPLVAVGASAYRIALEPGASPSEQTAAEELRAAVLAATGVDLPVVTGASPDDGPLVVVGGGPMAAALGVAPDAAALGEQGALLRTVPPHVVVAGTPGAGTLYGVHRLIEEVAGVRWLAPGVTRAPTATALGVPPLDRLERPAFLWRHTSYAWPGGDDAFLARMGDNSGDKGPADPWGLEHAHDGRAHSYFRFVSPDEFFDAHPEYFSEVGGVRLRDETQLCLTNPEVLEIVTERMLARMAAEPHVRQHNFSQHDHYNYCTCDDCRAVNEQYGTTGGTQFWFVSRLAERTAAVYPDKLIGTLAYMYTEEPPVGLELHPNVAVWLCHMYPSCDSHPIATCPLNADYRRRAEAWSDLTAHLYIWHYITNFTHYYQPFPNFRALAANLRFYRDIGVEGIYLQGMGHGGGGGEFSLLRPYYGMRLLWDPDRDPDRLLDEFLAGYYGAAAAPLRAYVDRLHDEVEDNDIHMHLYTNPAQGYLSDEVMAFAAARFDEAEAAVADDPELLERVRVARMPLAYATFFPRNGYTVECPPEADGAGADGARCWLRWQGARATTADIQAFVGRMAAHGFTTVREAAGDPQTLFLLNSLVSTDQAVERIANDHLAVDVAPHLGGRALRIVHRASGQTVTAYDVRRSLFYPFQGGLEDRVGGPFEFYGWVEPTSVSDRGPGTLTVRQDTLNGFRIERTLALAADAPVLTVTTTLTNAGAAPQTVHLRAHLELDLGELRATRVRFTDRAGAATDRDLDDVIAGLREGTHFYAGEAPAGEWTFSGSKGLAVTQRFDDAAVDFTWLYAYPEDLGELELEVWAPRTTLGPDESLVLEHTLEVRPAAR